MTLNIYFLRNSSNTLYSIRMLQKCWCARRLPWALHSCWCYGKTRKQNQRLCKIRCYHRWMLRSYPRLPSTFNFLISIILPIKMTLNSYFLRNSSNTPYSTRMLQKFWCARILPWALHSSWCYGKTRKQNQRLCKIRCYHRWMLRSYPRLPIILNFLTSIILLIKITLN